MVEIKRLEKFNNEGKIAEEAIKMLQQHVRINTTYPPGNEIILAKIIEKTFNEENFEFIDTKIIESAPNRGNLIITIKGTDSSNHPIWGFASHLDVVPAEALDDWKYPPFSGELVEEEYDKFIWGRGTFDMKHIGVSQAMAVLILLREGWRPKGDIKLIFESDEERGGRQGLRYILEDNWESFKVDCLITEGGGFKLPIGNDFAVQAGEKGKCQTRIKAKGVSGHGSTPDPFKQFALYKLVKILQKLKKKNRKVHIIPEYKNLVANVSVPKPLKFLLKRKSIIRKLLGFASKISHQPLKKTFMPMMTDTIVPTIIKGGSKENVISPNAELTLDIRTLPGHDKDYIFNRLRKLIGDKLYSELVLEPIDIIQSTTSPINTSFYKDLGETLREMYPKANLVPIIGIGGTDMRFFRMRNIPCYGFSLLLKDKGLSYGDLIGMAHAPNERISVTNLMLATEYMYRLIRKL